MVVRLYFGIESGPPFPSFAMLKHGKKGERGFLLRLRLRLTVERFKVLS
jgi:hypothetical protein